MPDQYGISGGCVGVDSEEETSFTHLKSSQTGEDTVINGLDENDEEENSTAVIASILHIAVIAGSKGPVRGMGAMGTAITPTDYSHRGDEGYMIFPYYEGEFSVRAASTFSAVTHEVLHLLCFSNHSTFSEHVSSGKINGREIFFFKGPQTVQLYGEALPMTNEAHLFACNVNSKGNIFFGNPLVGVSPFWKKIPKESTNILWAVSHKRCLSDLVRTVLQDSGFKLKPDIPACRYNRGPIKEIVTDCKYF